MTYDYHVKLIDFGISKHNDMTRQTKLSEEGTTRYMSPEQLKPGKISYKNDIWAFGAVLLEYSTGVRIYENLPSDY